MVPALEIIKLEENNSVHIEAFKELVREYAAFQDRLGIRLQFQDLEKEIQQLPGKYSVEKGGVVLLAKLDDKVAGCVAIRIIELESQMGKIGEIKRLFVTEKAQGNKVGYSLLSSLLVVGKDLEFSKLYLDTCARLVCANKLYRKLGFAETFRYCENPFEDALFFEISL